MCVCACVCVWLTLAMMVVPVLVLQNRPHKFLCSTGMEHKKRLTKQGVLLKHTHTHTQKKCFSLTVDQLHRCLHLLPVGWWCWEDSSEDEVWSWDAQISTHPLMTGSSPLPPTGNSNITQSILIQKWHCIFEWMVELVQFSYIFPQVSFCSYCQTGMSLLLPFTFLIKSTRHV